MARACCSARATLRSHWLPRLLMARSHWSRPTSLFPAIFYFILLLGISSATTPSPPRPRPRDPAPSAADTRSTFPRHNLTHPHDAHRDKRSSQHFDNDDKTPRRVKTGDTILNIRGAVRDAIGDAGAAPGGRASSRLDTLVIRPAHAAARAPHPPDKLPLNQVPRHPRSQLVEPHARARLLCDLPGLTELTELTWYKDDEQVSVSGSEGTAPVWLEAGGAALVIARATRGDAGAWRCAGRARAAAGPGPLVSGQPTLLLIYEAVRSVYLAVDGRRLDAGNTWVPARDKTELEVTCVAEGGVPPPELAWRLQAAEASLDARLYLRVQPTNYSIDGVSVSRAVVRAARELHNATLQCSAAQPPRAAPAPPPAKLTIHVTYPPSFVISRWPGFGVSLAAGGAAALRCDVDANPPARAWWLRDDDNPTSSPPPLEAGDEARGSATLRWAALRGSHAGWYRCRASWLDAEYSSIGYYLNVIASEEQTEAATEASPAAEEHAPEQQKVEVPVGGNVQLHCPKGSVGCWWRKVVGNGTAWAPAGSAHAHGVLGIRDALYEEGGEYRCLGVPAQHNRHLQELKRVTVRVTGGATAAAVSASPARGGWLLECAVCGRGVRALWVRRDRAAPAALSAERAPHCHRAVLHVTTPDEIWCVASTATGGAVAVFPPRAPPPSPAPARHSVRAHNAGAAHTAAALLLLAAASLW